MITPGLCPHADLSTRRVAHHHPTSRQQISDFAGTLATGLSELLGDGNAIGDKGYIGTGILTPYRKSAGGELLDWQKEFNTTVNKIRYVIERSISQFKTWRCMHTDYRRPARTYARAFNAVSAPLFQTAFRISLNPLES